MLLLTINFLSMLVLNNIKLTISLMWRKGFDRPSNRYQQNWNDLRLLIDMAIIFRTWFWVDGWINLNNNFEGYFRVVCKQIITITQCKNMAIGLRINWNKTAPLDEVYTAPVEYIQVYKLGFNSISRTKSIIHFQRIGTLYVYRYVRTEPPYPQNVCLMHK